MRFFKNSVWLSTSSQELRPSVLLDTSRPWTVRQRVVAKPNEISHFSREQAASPPHVWCRSH